MNIDPEAARAKADELQTLHDQCNSWRKVQKLHYPTVNFATLNRIARMKGEWLPGDRRILKALGLIQRRERTEIEKRISKMARETNHAIIRRKP